MPSTVDHKMIPSKMKAAIATGFGAIDDNVALVDDWPTPLLEDKDREHVLIKVLACALAPGDLRVLAGHCDYVQMPSGGHPYVVGSDVSGIVVASHCTKFQPGDYVVARFDEPKPNGGVAEYRLVKCRLTEKCPPEIPPLQACGLPASAMAAKRIVRDYVKPNDRVLVIGGSGGVGTCILQYAKYYGAAFVGAVSTQEELCKSLGADLVVDYRKHNWWDVVEFQQAPFDVVIDLVNGGNWEKEGLARTAIRRGGTYVASLTGVQTEIIIHSLKDMILAVFNMVGRMLWTRLNPSVPNWVAPEALKLEDGDLAELFQDVVERRLKPVLDPSSPFEFTEQGIRNALRLQQSVHAHGKVVIKIADE